MREERMGEEACWEIRRGDGALFDLAWRRMTPCSSAGAAKRLESGSGVKEEIGVGAFSRYAQVG
jgi:hypothetical protein